MDAHRKGTERPESRGSHAGTLTGTYGTTDEVIAFVRDERAAWDNAEPDRPPEEAALSDDERDDIADMAPDEFFASMPPIDPGRR